MPGHELLPIEVAHEDGTPCRHQRSSWTSRCPGLVFTTGCSCGWSYESTRRGGVYDARCRHREAPAPPRAVKPPTPAPAPAPACRPVPTHQKAERVCTRDWSTPPASGAPLVEAAPLTGWCPICDTLRCARADGTVLWHEAMDRDRVRIECPGTGAPGRRIGVAA